ncbi:MAG: hypothetical protein JWP97_6249 [Labilithrix sp.]|nr:hypothetical protein [Labilithrix sp.]
MSTINRRNVMLNGLFGAGLLGLRSIATGLPIAFLSRPLEARADTPVPCADKALAQYLVLSTSDSGDPLNCNVPGTYAFPSIAHPLDPLMAKTSLTLAGTATTAAKPWASLPQGVLDRTSFMHHTTLNNGHGGESKVLRLMGATKRSEMFVSIFSRYLAGCLGTIQAQPVSLGAHAGEVLSYDGRSLPPLTPSGLRNTLLNTPGALTNLQKLRDADLDRLNALFKTSGTNVQRAYLDRMAKSQTEARNISQNLLDALSSITADDTANQMIAAGVLIQMNVSPVISVHVSFGGDNHNDADLAGEAASTIAGVASIQTMLANLAGASMQDRVTFAAMNVFGRTLANKGTTGRDHLGNHHVTVMVGKNVKGSVIGGVTPNGNDYKALPINSTTGAGEAGGDITFDDTLGAVGKTLGAALGVPAAVLDDQITHGKIIKAALAA